MQLDDCIKMNEETLTMSKQTAQMLMEQEETINRIDNKLDIVDANNKKSAKVVKSMSSIFGQIKNIIFGVKSDPAVTSMPQSTKPEDKMPTLKEYNIEE